MTCAHGTATDQFCGLCGADSWRRPELLAAIAAIAAQATRGTVA